MEVLAKVPQQPWGIQLAMDPPKEPESRFLFVNATNKSRAPNNATARAVRQHVMRDIGRSRRKRRNPQFELELRPAAPPPGPSPQGVQVESSQLAAERPWAFLAGRALDLHSEGAWNMQCEGAESSPTVELPRTKDATQATPPALARPFWDQHPAQMFDDVLPMDPFAAYSLALALSQPPSCLKDKTPLRVRKFWFPLAYSDSELFREMLLGTAMRDAARGSNAQTNYELSTARYTAGIRCISSRLSSQNLRGANAENIIRAIIGLTCYDYLMQDYSRTDLHLDGMQRVINIQGGLEALSHNPQLRLMIFCIDIASALVRHSSPRFPPPTELLPALVPPQPSRDDVARFGRLTSTWVQTFPDLVDVVDALRNLKALSTVIDGEHASRGEQLWYDEIFIGFRANPVAHRLLTASYAEDAVHPRLRIREASRLAALLTIVYLKMKCSSYPAQLPAWYATQILAAMNDEQMSLPEFAPLKLWMLLICGIVSSGDQRLAVTSIMVDSIRTLMLSSWVEAMDQIKLMPWMDSLLGIAGGYFGQEVTAALE